MSTTCTPATDTAVDVTSSARAAGLGPGFRAVMTGGAHHRALAHSERPGEGVGTVLAALHASLAALLDVERPLLPGTTWTVATGECFPLRWAVLVAADEHDAGALVLYLAPA